MHRGTDFAAPSGTPIMASGSGTVTRARWCGGGGNCVKIKHNSTYETIYAHMKAFAKGIKEGRKVKQGQIIGYEFDRIVNRASLHYGGNCKW